MKNASTVNKVFHPEMYNEPKTLTPFIALDCEMVEVEGYEDALA
jgi:hypothetical protein